MRAVGASRRAWPLFYPIVRQVTAVLPSPAQAREAAAAEGTVLAGAPGKPLELWRQAGAAFAAAAVRDPPRALIYSLIWRPLSSPRFSFFSSLLLWRLAPVPFFSSSLVSSDDFSSPLVSIPLLFPTLTLAKTKWHNDCSGYSRALKQLLGPAKPLSKLPLAAPVQALEPKNKPAAAGAARAAKEVAQLDGMVQNPCLRRRCLVGDPCPRL